MESIGTTGTTPHRQASETSFVPNICYGRFNSMTMTQRKEI